MPSDPLWIEGGVQDRPLMQVLLHWPWIGTLRRDEELPTKLLLSVDSVDGSGTLRMDQPLSGFAERRLGARYVKSYWIPFPRRFPCFCIGSISIPAARKDAGILRSI
jgi:CRISPR system Cascade subunit CasD